MTHYTANRSRQSNNNTVNKKKMPIFLNIHNKNSTVKTLSAVEDEHHHQPKYATRSDVVVSPKHIDSNSDDSSDDSSDSDSSSSSSHSDSNSSSSGSDCLSEEYFKTATVSDDSILMTQEEEEEDDNEDLLHDQDVISRSSTGSDDNDDHKHDPTVMMSDAWYEAQRAAVATEKATQLKAWRRTNRLSIGRRSTDVTHVVLRFDNPTTTAHHSDDSSSSDEEEDEHECELPHHHDISALSSPPPRRLPFKERVIQLLALITEAANRDWHQTVQSYKKATIMASSSSSCNNNHHHDHHPRCPVWGDVADPWYTLRDTFMDSVRYHMAQTQHYNQQQRKQQQHQAARSSLYKAEEEEEEEEEEESAEVNIIMNKSEEDRDDSFVKKWRDALATRSLFSPAPGERLQ